MGSTPTPCSKHAKIGLEDAGKVNHRFEPSLDNQQLFDSCYGSTGRGLRTMDTRWKVKIHCPQIKNLSKRQAAFLKALNERLDRVGLQVAGDSPSRASIIDRYKSLRDCDGVIILAYSQWEGRRISDSIEKNAIFPSEFTHMGIVQSALSGRPYLILRERSVSDRGTLRKGFAEAPIDLPKSLDEKWLDSDDFNRDFEPWLKSVKERCHIFLGYSSQSTDVANLISKFLTEKLQVRVFDWHSFAATDTIWDSIERAEKLTNCGIFLFMTDDEMKIGKGKQFAPRDNVVFEAGYFAGAKRRSRSLIVRETGAKIPTDFGGVLYLTIDNRKSIASIETQLRDHVVKMLTGSG